MPEPSQSIPQSLALAEASAESLSDLFSRDPETFSPGDVTRLIETLRAMRVKWQASEAAGAGAKAKPASARAAGLLSVKAEDLGL